jgi:hypothetical protein
MSFDSGTQNAESEWAPRPVILPVFKIPARLAVPVAWGLVASATLSIIATLVSAVSYRRFNPPIGSFSPGIRIFNPSIRFADRISVFVSGANLTVALLLLVAVMVIAMAGREDGAEVPLTRRLALLTTVTVVASIVVLANVAQAIVILSNATGQLANQYSADKAASILSLLPPVFCAASAAMYALTRIRKAPEPPDPADG